LFDKIIRKKNSDAVKRRPSKYKKKNKIVKISTSIIEPIAVPSPVPSSVLSPIRMHYDFMISPDDYQVFNQDFEKLIDKYYATSTPVVSPIPSPNASLSSFRKNHLS
jgi:hypothetical protein